MSPLILVVFIVAIGLVLLIGGIAVLMTRGSSEQALTKAERLELASARTMIEDLKQIAWDHREIDPALSTIFIDTIRHYERTGQTPTVQKAMEDKRRKELGG